MAASTNNVLSKRRRASVNVNAGLPLETFSAPSSYAPSSKSPRTSVLLDELPGELGVLIVNHLTIEAMANLTLCNKTTAGWVSKSLLAKVTRCETNVEEGERERTEQGSRRKQQARPYVSFFLFPSSFVVLDGQRPRPSP